MDNKKGTSYRKVITHKGVTGTLSELAKHFKIPYSRAYARLYRNLPLDIVFSQNDLSLKGKAEKYTFKGVTGTLPELAEHFGVLYSTAYARLHSGKSLNIVFSQGDLSFKGKADKYTFKGVTGTLPELAEHFGVPYSTVYFRLNSGKPLEVVFSSKYFKFDTLTYKGVTGTLSELCKHFGVNYNTAYGRLVSKKPLDVVFSPEASKLDILTYKGVTGTLSELSNHFGVKYSKAYGRLKAGKSLDVVFSKKENLIKDKAKKYTYKGVTGTLPELTKHFKVEYRTAYRRLKENKPLEEVFNPKYHKKHVRKSNK